MALITGGNNPGNTAHVSSDGRLQSRAVTLSEQAQKSISGDSYNVNTSSMTLTTANETPIFYLKNDTEDQPLVIPRVFLTALASTGGTGKLQGKIYSNITGGTILSAANLAPQNFNFGSSKSAGVTLKIGANGLTFSGGVSKVEFLYPATGVRSLTGFESIILPRGASMLFTITAPAGNTSMEIQAGTNFYIDGDFQ